VWLVFSLGLGGCAVPRMDAHSLGLPAPVQAALQQAGLPADALAAIAIPRAASGAPALRTWQHRADVPMQPASTMKVLTGIVAMDQLGPNHRGFTELWADGPVQGEVLQGDVVLKAGADPELDLPALWGLLHELRLRGVKRIEGGVRLDRSLFNPARTDVGQPPFDDAPEWYYNVVPDALLLNSHLMGIKLASDRTRVSAQLWPPLEGVRIDASAMTLNDAKCADWDDTWQTPTTAEPQPGQHVIALRGSYPKNCEAQASLQLLDRDVIAERQVRAVWASLGGSFAQAPTRAVEGKANGTATLMAKRTARPWGEVLRVINKSSDNALTRLLYLQLGRDAPVGSTTLAQAHQQVQAWFDAQGIDRTGLVLDNGSGLSRSERIAPRTLARMIDAALSGKHAPELLMSLPTAGVDGTMRRRLKGTAAEGWARLKTGTLKNVAALAGTVRDTRGDTWVVVAMVNHDEANTDGKGRKVLDALIEWVANSGARWR
jgi:serine-type D-Ala-D-Ala carboxypeptidase/endopeptidase (penicillin-binding protein 4)